MEVIPPSSLPPTYEPGQNLEKIRARHNRYLISGAPRFRIIGFFALSLTLAVYLIFLGNPQWLQIFLLFLTIVEIYALGAWVIQRWFYLRYRNRSVYLAFMVLDIGAYLYAIYLTGGQESWLIFVLLCRVADQIHLGVLRPLVFAHLIVLGYAALLGFLVLVEGQTPDWALEGAKMLVLLGSGIYISLTAIPAQDIRRKMKTAIVESQRLLGALGQKSTQYLREKERAEEQSRTKARFLENMSHEIRTPVNSILGMMQLLKDTPMNEEQERYLQALHYSTDSLMGVIDHILDYDQLSQGQIKLDSKPYSLRGILEHISDRYIPGIYSHDLELWIMLDQTFPAQVIGDPHRVKQVFNHLLSNAVKFTHEGDIKIHCHWVDTPEAIPHDQAYWQLLSEQDHQAMLDLLSQNASGWIFSFICDTGVGVPQEKLGSIFQQFSQVDDSNSRAYGGTGLGLALVKELVTLMQGVYGVHSIPEKGSIFWFAMPTEAVAGTTPQPCFEEETSIIHLCETQDPHGHLRAYLNTLNLECQATHLFKNHLIQHPEQSPQLCLIHTNNQKSLKEIVQKCLTPEAGLPRHIGICTTPANVSYLAQHYPHMARQQILAKPLKRQTIFNWLHFQKSDTPPEPLQSSVTAQCGPSLQGMSILVAEDDLFSQMVLAKLLTDQGANVTRCNNGREAVGACAKTSFDLILMDVQMPEMDGLEATRRIRELEQEKTGRIPILAVSASILSGETEALFKAGMDGFLPKPVRLQSLNKILGNLLG